MFKKEDKMKTCAIYSASNDSESTILPVRVPNRDDMDDESLDDLYAVQDADIDDFSRGGK